MKFRKVFTVAVLFCMITTVAFAMSNRGMATAVEPGTYTDEVDDVKLMMGEELQGFMEDAGISEGEGPDNDTVDDMVDAVYDGFGDLDDLTDEDASYTDIIEVEYGDDNGTFGINVEFDALIADGNFSGGQAMMVNTRIMLKDNRSLVTQGMVANKSEMAYMYVNYWYDANGNCTAENETTPVSIPGTQNELDFAIEDLNSTEINDLYIFSMYINGNITGGDAPEECDSYIDLYDINEPSVPGLSSDAGDPDEDGNFTLSWTASDFAENYTIYRHTENFTEIHEDLTVVANDLVNNVTSYTINDLENGTYYFAVVSENQFGETMSNTVMITVERDDGAAEDGEYMNFFGNLINLIISLIIAFFSSIFGAGIVYYSRKKTKSVKCDCIGEPGCPCDPDNS